MALWGKKQKSDGKTDSVDKPAAESTRRVAIPEVEPAPAAPSVQGPASVAKSSEASAPASDAKANRALDRDTLQKKAAESKRLLLAFGEVASVLMKTPQFKGLSLGQLEALAVPAILTGQFVVAEAHSQESGFVSPVATALWATVSPEIDKRLSEELEQPIRLAPNEWRSGDIPWLVVAAGDPRVINPMLRNVQDKQLQGRVLKARVKNAGGKMEVGSFKAT